MYTATDTPTKERTRRTVSPAPAYQRIADDIVAKVRDGRLPAGTMLPSRHNLAKQYGVALSTAQQAIANLIADGTLMSQDRRGTFVSQPRPHPDSSAETSLSLDTDRYTEPLPLKAPSFLWQPDVQITTAVLGIVATSLIDQAPSPDVGSLWARQSIRALEEVFSAAEGTTLFFDRFPQGRAGYDYGLDDPQAISMTEAILSLHARGANALAIVGLCDGRDVSDEIVAAVDVEKVPVVYLSWHEMRPPVSQVFYDSRFAGYQAAQHLLKKGYNRLIFLVPFQESWLTERIDGARDAVRHAGLPQETLQVSFRDQMLEKYHPDHAATWTYEAARAAFAEHEVFTNTDSGLWGIIAPNDFTAQAVLQAAREENKEAGADYGLIGFDDDPLSCSAGLTTVRPPIEAMGQEAGRLLLRALSGEVKGLQMRLRSQIIPRASTSMR